jgi:hypothetical protein
MRASSTPRLERAQGSLVFDSGLHWRALRADDGTIFEFVHPGTGLLYCQARVDRSFSCSEVLFSESAPRDRAHPGWQLPYPLEQLVLVPAFAIRGTVLFHACGAVMAGSGFVFAGHSGEGKTTLGGLLHGEGAPLLSDERVAVRHSERGFFAFGTPWPGEGNVVSNAGRPLGAMFVLKKATRHALGPPSPGLAPELIARAIVPYYLPEIAERVFGAFSELASTVPFRELHFARAPGLTALLRDSIAKA